MANPEPRPGRFCDAGHTLDPSWDKCPYCDGERRSKEQTYVSRSHPPPVSASSDDRKTKVGAIPAGTQRETKTMSPGVAPGLGAQGGVGETRRIMGVLITYTWRPEGQLFAIREGKNFIGAGNVSSDASHRLCDILITNDPRLSSEHALILCRHGRYDIVDHESSNGTFLNSEIVPLQGTDLPNYAEIKTGSTVWTFIKINPPASEIVAPPPAPPKGGEGPKPPEPDKPKEPTQVG